VDVVRFGSDVRLLRRRRGWSQRRLAAEAKVSRWSIVTVEGGRDDQLPLAVLVAIIAAVGGYLSVRIMFHGEVLDRLRDKRHAALVEGMVERLRADGWDVATQVSFNDFGERGSIDILAFHASTRTLLVIEVKTVVPDVGGSLATLDRKVRLAPEIARTRGWNPRIVARLLVMAETSTVRRRIAAHEATFANAFPARNVEVNRWLRAPVGSISGLMILSTDREGDKRRGPTHIREAREVPRRTRQSPLPVK
jgi:DNA-binding XRE family transcriptional regulator